MGHPADALMLAGNSATFPPPGIINADQCGVYRWSLVAVTPTPTGVITVDSLTGAVTFDSDRSDGFGGMDTPYDIVIEVTDGISQKACTFVVDFFGVADACCVVAGDVDNSGSMNIADVSFMIDRIFNGGPAPVCCGSADLNLDNSLNIGDVTFLIARIFSGGPAPQCGMAFSCN